MVASVANEVSACRPSARLVLLEPGGSIALDMYAGKITPNPRATEGRNIEMLAIVT